MWVQGFWVVGGGWGVWAWISCICAILCAMLFAEPALYEALLSPWAELGQAETMSPMEGLSQGLGIGAQGSSREAWGGRTGPVRSRLGGQVGMWPSGRFAGSW